MVQPIHSYGSSEPISDDETPQEKQKLFEIEFETAILGDYISVSEKNGSLKQQISKLKNELLSGQSSEHLAASLNQLIDQINRTISPGKAKFPPFQFSSEGSSATALTHYAMTLEKLLNAAAEKGAVAWNSEQTLFRDLSALISCIPSMTPSQATERLNSLIDQANAVLPSSLHIPSLPDELRR